MADWYGGSDGGSDGGSGGGLPKFVRDVSGGRSVSGVRPKCVRGASGIFRDERAVGIRFVRHFRRSSFSLALPSRLAGDFPLSPPRSAISTGYASSAIPASARRKHGGEGLRLRIDFAASPPVLHRADVVHVLETLAEMAQCAESQLFADVGYVVPA